MTGEPPLPRMRENFIGGEALERRLADMVATGALSHGWMITGRAGAGKATLAYRLARALLHPARGDRQDLFVDAADQTFRWVGSQVHPDLFVAERRFDAKKERRETEISIDTIRELIAFLGKTSTTGGWRVAIVDSADDLNANSANALLKALEEPPAKTTLFVLTTTPGRVLATIRSRCRRIDLAPAPLEKVAQFVATEAGVDADIARRCAEAAEGRPGYALSLATSSGGEAVAAGDAFLAAAVEGRQAREAERLTGRDQDGAWEIFKTRLLQRLAAAARDQALGAPPAGDPAALADAYHQLNLLFARGEGLNADRQQILLSAGRLIGRAFRAAA